MKKKDNRPEYQKKFLKDLPSSQIVRPGPFGEWSLPDGHPAPVSRRQFLSYSFFGSATFLMAPTIAEWAQQQGLYAQSSCEDPYDPSMIPIFILDLAGGAPLTSNIIVGGRGGQRDFLQGSYTQEDRVENTTFTYTDYEGYGWTPEMNPATHPELIDSTFGLLMHSESAFVRGIKHTFNLSDQHHHLDGMSIACRVGSDSSANSLAPTQLFKNFGVGGSLAYAIGRNARPSGGRHRSASGPKPRGSGAMFVGDRSSNVRNIAGRGRVNTLIANRDESQKILDVIASMGQESFERFKNLSPDDQLQAIIDCGYDSAVTRPSSVALDDIYPSNPGADPIISQCFPAANAVNTTIGGQTIGLLSNTTAVAAAAKALADGLVGVAVHSEGSHDQHSNDVPRSPYNNLLIAGARLGQVIKYFSLRQKPVAIIVTSDGGMSASKRTERRYLSVSGHEMYGHPGDSDPRSATLMFVYHPGIDNRTNSLFQPHAIQSGQANRQLGAYNLQGADLSYLAVASSTDRVAHALVYNYLALHGRESEYTRVTNGSPVFTRGSDAEAQQYLKFRKIT
jgi:hypothetical protein